MTAFEDTPVVVAGRPSTYGELREAYTGLGTQLTTEALALYLLAAGPDRLAASYKGACQTAAFLLEQLEAVTAELAEVRAELELLRGAQP